MPSGDGERGRVGEGGAGAEEADRIQVSLPATRSARRWRHACTGPCRPAVQGQTSHGTIPCRDRRRAFKPKRSLRRAPSRARPAQQWLSLTSGTAGSTRALSWNRCWMTPFRLVRDGLGPSLASPGRTARTRHARAVRHPCLTLGLARMSDCCCWGKAGGQWWQAGIQQLGFGESGAADVELPACHCRALIWSGFISAVSRADDASGQVEPGGGRLGACLFEMLGCC
jgi:hypothetical protein